eukprot:4801557-Pleurochrysis_carterae.AAC.3
MSRQHRNWQLRDVITAARLCLLHDPPCDCEALVLLDLHVGEDVVVLGLGLGRVGERLLRRKRDVKHAVVSAALELLDAGAQRSVLIALDRGRAEHVHLEAVVVRVKLGTDVEPHRAGLEKELAGGTLRHLLKALRLEVGRRLIVAVDQLEAKKVLVRHFWHGLQHHVQPAQDNLHR